MIEPKNLVLMSHLGRPDGKRIASCSLKQIVPVLEQFLGSNITFIDDCVGPDVEKICNSIGNGGVILLENLRFHPEEEKSLIDETTGKKVR